MQLHAKLALGSSSMSALGSHFRAAVVRAMALLCQFLSSSFEAAIVCARWC